MQKITTALAGFALLLAGLFFVLNHSQMQNSKPTSKSPSPTEKTQLQSSSGEFVNLKHRISTGFGRHQFEIHDSGAAFIKLKVDNFNLKPGQVLSVTNPDQSERYEYHANTFAMRAQPSLLSISGDTAFITIEGPSSWFNFGSVTVLGYWRDKKEKVVPFSTCGSSQRKNVACYTDSNPEAVRRANPVAKLWAGSLQCTAWRVGAGNRFLTNNHCMSRASTAADAELWFDYQYTSCNGRSLRPTIKVPVKRILKTNFELDYTLFEVENFDAISEFGYLGIDLEPVTKGQGIFIPQHGDGDPKQLAIESDRNVGGLCAIDLPSTFGNAPDTDMGYFCDTLGGSSGSPVLSTANSLAVALHHFGGCENKGVKLSLIWPQIQHYFHDQLPSSDEGIRLDNRLPELDYNVESQQLSASIRNNSADPDGFIVSHQWRLGEKLLSEEPNPSFEFEMSGTYPISYSALDNDDAPQYIEGAITVLERRDNGQVILGNGAEIEVKPSLNNTMFVLDVPANALNLSIIVEGREANLAVRKNSPPTRFRSDCSSSRRILSKECFFSSVAPGEYYVQVSNVNTNSARLKVNFTTQESGLDERWNNLEGREDDWSYFSIDVPAGMSWLEIKTQGGYGDLDLYVQKGGLPDRDYWRCQSDGWDTEERCRISRPSAGKWYIGLLGRWDYDGVDLIVTARP